MDYAARMSDQSSGIALAEQVETRLRAALAEGDAAVAGVGAVLRHLLATPGGSLFSDEIVARLQGLALDLARQFMPDVERERREALAAALLADRDILVHLHALCVETSVTLDLEARCGLDPALSPLLRDMVADASEDVAIAAMQGLTAQAQFMQRQTRMAVLLSDLPSEKFERALDIFAEQGVDAEEKTPTLRDAKDGNGCRARRLSALVESLDAGDLRALDIDNAGIAIFLSALHVHLGIPRDEAALLLSPSQALRLALSLRVAGLDPTEAERQLSILHGDIALPDGWDRLSDDTAGELVVMGGESRNG